MSKKDLIDVERLPKHVAVIMDGNGRWAKQRGKPRVFGHQSGVVSVRETAEAAAELGIEYLTLYAFSTENWKRPRLEIEALMALLLQTINKETKTLNKNNIRLKAIGDLSSLPGKTRRQLEKAMENTAGNTKMTLVLALSYSARWELLNAVQNIATKVEAHELKSSDVNQEVLEENLATAGMPDPELLIRTSGEFRISNFLLWQIAYAELYFTDKRWPDFRKEDLYDALIDYQSRERRFGKISEQINAE